MSDENTTLPSVNPNEWPNEIEEDSIITSFTLGILENSTYESVENDNDLHYHTSYINEERQSSLPANEYTSEFMRIEEDLLVSQDVSNVELHDQSSGMEYPDFSDSFVTDVVFPSCKEMVNWVQQMVRDLGMIIRETTDGFSWALEKFKLMLDGLTPLVMLTDADAALMKALEVVFPQVTKLLCRFHINMNVAHRARKELPNVESCQKISSLWDRLVSSATDAEVECQWNYIVEKFKEFPDLIDYLQNTWMSCREKFVDAWSDCCVNFGEKTTN
ncbi:hypothetical protein IFM89_022810 [Coptis chinensis]|uniref:MULE transposase domain-containing protein n=1 Tax=Coptis chinensis TaxID=261450 RepID=A0A835I2N1_9MAGN|nr:hypothetical protein IFM89_022810 [Coptis chinensis]